MRLPKRINPDSIREAIVEFRYHTHLSFELIPGILFQVFDDSYTYTDRPIKSLPSVPTIVSPGREVRLQVGSQNLLYNDKIILQVLPNSFVFSCLNKYIGWDLYREEIKKALNIIKSTNIHIQWSRLGLRYISEYREQDLRNCTKFDFTFGLTDIKSETMAFKSEFQYKGSKAILNLNNRVPLQIPITGGVGFAQINTSLIDIDLLRELREPIEVADVMSIVEEVHVHEKEIFFGMLQEKFLETLDPEY